MSPLLADVLRIDRDEVVVDPSSTYEMAGVRSFGRGLFARPLLAGDATSYRRLYRLRAGQVVLSRLFAWEGAVATVAPGFDGWFVSSEFPTFTVDPERALPAYVSHFVRWPAFHQGLAGVTRGLGQRRQRVHAEDFLRFSIPLPPIDEQRRVAAHLDRIEAAAEQLRQKAATAATLSGALAVSLAARPDLDGMAKKRAGVATSQARIPDGAGHRARRRRGRRVLSERRPSTASGRGLFSKPDIEWPWRMRCKVVVAVIDPKAYAPSNANRRL